MSKKSKKVKVAIFDGDQKIRKLGKFPITDDGSKLKILKGGKRHFYPEFGPNSFLEFPRSRFLGGGWERVYIVRNHASECVNFLTSSVPGPDPEQVKDAAEATILTRFGVEKQSTPLILYIIVILQGLAFLKIMGVIP